MDGNEVLRCILLDTHEGPHVAKHFQWGGSRKCLHPDSCMDAYLHGCFYECDRPIYEGGQRARV